MAYPSDSGVSYTSKTNNIDVVQASDINNLQIETSAIKTLLGIIGSAVNGTFYYLMSEITGSDKAVGKTAAQTLTNKTLTSPTITGATITTSSVNGVTIQTGGSSTNFLAQDGTYQPGASANASTTVKGIVEAATSAEITAGTATGGTGAVLAVTPDALAASTPVFNASGLTGTMKKVVSTTTPITQIVSSTAETTIYTTSIPANMLGTSNGILIRAYTQTFNTSGSSVTTTYRLKYGATTVQTYVETTTNGNSTIGETEFRLLANGSTSSQVSDMILNHVVSGLQVDASGTASEDSTIAKNLVLTVQLSVNSANARFDSKNYSVHVLA